VDAELERRLLQVLLAVMSRGPSIVTAVHRLPAVIFYLIASLAPSLIKEGPLVHLRHVQYSPASSVTEDGAALPREGKGVSLVTADTLWTQAPGLAISDGPPSLKEKDPLMT
jgi:hypothetical protein